jgi:hypothetical protein
MHVDSAEYTYNDSDSDISFTSTIPDNHTSSQREMFTKLTDNIDTTDNSLRSRNRILDDIDHWSAHLDSLHLLDPARKRVRQIIDDLYSEALSKRSYQYQLPGPSLNKHMSATRKKLHTAKKASSESQPQLWQSGGPSVDAPPRIICKLSKPPCYSPTMEETRTGKTFETKKDVRQQTKVDNDNLSTYDYEDTVWSFDIMNSTPRNSASSEITLDAPSGYSCGSDLQGRMLEDFDNENDGVIGSSRPAVSTPTEEDSGDENNVTSDAGVHASGVDAVEDHNTSGLEYIPFGDPSSQLSHLHGGPRATVPNWGSMEEHRRNLATFGQVQAQIHEQKQKQQIGRSRLHPTSVDMTPELGHASTGTQIPYRPFRGDPGIYENHVSYSSSLNWTSTPKTEEKGPTAVKIKDELARFADGDEDSERRQDVGKVFNTRATPSPDDAMVSLRKAFRALGLAEYISVDYAQLHSSFHSMLSLPWVRNNHQLTLQVVDAFNTVDKYQDEHGCWELCRDHQEPNPMENQMNEEERLNTEAGNDSDNYDNDGDVTLPLPKTLMTSHPMRFPAHTPVRDNTGRKLWALHDFFNLPRGDLEPNAIPQVPAHIEAEIDAILEESRLAELSRKLPVDDSIEKMEELQDNGFGDATSAKDDPWKFSVPAGGNDGGAPSEVESIMSEVNINVEKDVPQPKPSVLKTYTVTYWATIEAEGDTVHIPIDSENITGAEKSIIESDASMKKVWKWVQEKGLGDKVGLQDAFDLAEEMRGDVKVVEKKEFVAPAYCHSNKGRNRRSSSVSSRSSRTTTGWGCRW